LKSPNGKAQIWKYADALAEIHSMLMTVLDELKRHNFVLYYPFDESVPREKRRDVAMKALLADVSCQVPTLSQQMASQSMSILLGTGWQERFLGPRKPSL
jgi:hypothetical protein